MGEQTDQLEQARTLEQASDREHVEEIISEGVEMAWQTVDTPHRERGVLWYLGAALVAVVLIVYAIFTQAWTLAVAVAVLAGVVYLLSQEPTVERFVIITQAGIHINEQFYPYAKIRSFWFVDESDYRALHFVAGGKVGKEVHVQLGDKRVSHVRDVLSEYLDEDTEREERFLDMLARKMKL